MPRWAETSRTSRGMRENTDFTGCARIAMTPSCISRRCCDMVSRPFSKPAHISGGSAAAKLRQHRLVDDQFADQVHQPVHLVDVHPDRRARRMGQWSWAGGRGSGRPAYRAAASGSGSGVEGLDRQVAVILDEFERLLDRGARLLGVDQQRPGEIGLLRVQIAERRQAGQVGLDLDRGRRASVGG